MSIQTATTETRLIHAIEVSEGAGVTVYRSIGSPALPGLDPFLMLDAFNSDQPDDYIAGFPPHPHRGFCTFTYMIDGHFEHKDSLGNTGHLGPGGGQWMKAGSGVIHSEMPKQENGLMRGFQLWINLPAAHKMDPPEYQEFQSADFPLLQADGYRLKLLIGKYAGLSAPIVDELTGVVYLDVQLEAGKAFVPDLAGENSSFLYVYEGDGRLSGADGSKTPSANDPMVAVNTLALPDSRSRCFFAGEQGAGFILVSGRPINEAIVQYGPFVMNTREEIDQAVRDYQSNTFVRDRAWKKPGSL